MKDIGIIILAAGKGTRMKSDRAKVLHEISGQSMISYVVRTAVDFPNSQVVVVVGHQAERVKETVALDFKEVLFAYQDRQLGTGHAVMTALPYLNNTIDQVVVLCGDVPMISAATISSLISKNREERFDISLVAVEIDNPTGYGRIITNLDGDVLDIVEEADATPDQKKNKLINAGVYCINAKYLNLLLNEIKPNNAQDEYYLTDIVKIGNRKKMKVGRFIGLNTDEIIGINDMETLKRVENLMRTRQGKIS